MARSHCNGAVIDSGPAGLMLSELLSVSSPPGNTREGKIRVDRLVNLDHTRRVILLLFDISLRATDRFLEAWSEYGTPNLVATEAP